MENFSSFFQCSCLKLNYENCEIAGIGVLKSVKVAVCGMKCVDLCKDAIKILRMRSLTFEGKIIVFKTLTISKIVISQ